MEKFGGGGIIVRPLRKLYNELCCANNPSNHTHTNTPTHTHQYHTNVIISKYFQMESDDDIVTHLYEGLQFSSFDVAQDYISRWCAKNHSPLIIRGSYRGSDKVNGRIQYSCPHGIQRKSKNTGERPLQHVNFTDCPAMVNVMQHRASNCWRITKLCKDHKGHMMGPAVYGSYQNVRKLSDDHLQMVQDLEAVGASRRRVASVLSDKTGYQYTTKDVYNKIRKINQNINDAGKLEKYLADVQLEGGHVKWCKNDSGEVSVLWVQTQSMRSDVCRSRPWVWQTDTTFSTNRSVCLLWSAA